MLQNVVAQASLSEIWVQYLVSPCGQVLDNVVLGQISLRVLRLSNVSIIPPTLQSHLRHNTTSFSCVATALLRPRPPQC